MFFRKPLCFYTEQHENRAIFGDVFCDSFRKNKAQHDFWPDTSFTFRRTSREAAKGKSPVREGRACLTNFAKSARMTETGGIAHQVLSLRANAR